MFYRCVAGRLYKYTVPLSFFGWRHRSFVKLKVPRMVGGDQRFDGTALLVLARKRMLRRNEARLKFQPPVKRFDSSSCVLTYHLWYWAEKGVIAAVVVGYHCSVPNSILVCKIMSGSQHASLNCS